MVIAHASFNGVCMRLAMTLPRASCAPAAKKKSARARRHQAMPACRRLRAAEAEEAYMVLPRRGLQREG